MIETVVAENGSEVLRQDGRLLASMVDPQMEARAWLRRRQSLLRKVKSIFILGAGAGYHVAELESFSEAQLVVIEHSAQILDIVAKIQRFDSKRTHFCCVQRARSLRTSNFVKAALTQSFLVFTHAPSVVSQQEFYRECHLQLMGRDWGSLNWQWQLRGFAPLEPHTKIHSAEEPLTILDLEQTQLMRQSEERERMIVKALRELVK